MSQTAAAKLVEAVEQVGGRLASEGGRLKVSAPKPLPESLLEDLRHNKAALISYLNTSDEPPPEWAVSVERFRRMNRPVHVAPERWRQVVADAQRLLVDWGQTLLASGWLIEDVFGREPGDPQSVAWRVCGQTIWTVVSENSNAVVLRSADGRQTFIYQRAAK